MTRRTEATNTTSTYGWVERAFHWAIAGLMVAALVLGKLAYDAPFDTDEALARKAFLFSFHKTVGLGIFFTALARILWAVAQPRPRPLHGGIEGQVAALVHWLLYGSLVIVPLLGWAHHATAEGFAPIWWPFGQGLPGLDKDAALSKTLGVLHTTFVKVLVVALILHLVGTIKHIVIDRDQTFARMWKGTDPGPLETTRTHVLPLVGAGAIWAATLVAGLALVPTEEAVASGTAQVEGTSNWTVEEGTLSITVTQMGSQVTGSFSDWQAAIDFAETPRDDGTNGTVEVSVATGSLTLGSVTTQATGAEFLAAGQFPTATFEAVIRPEGEAYVADGTLEVRGVEAPLVLPFTLDIDGDTAAMTAEVALDRRDYEVGQAYPDESNVGFTVTVNVDLKATRTE